jgi:hypothetical protein
MAVYSRRMRRPGVSRVAILLVSLDTLRALGYLD